MDPSLSEAESMSGTRLGGWPNTSDAPRCPSSRHSTCSRRGRLSSPRGLSGYGSPSRQEGVDPLPSTRRWSSRRWRTVWSQSPTWVARSATELLVSANTPTETLEQ